MKQKISRSLDRQIKTEAKAIALAVRNGMEDFHINNLTQEQMKELNPIIRNAIYSFIRAKFEDISSLKLHYASIPTYWEDPVKIPF